MPENDCFLQGNPILGSTSGLVVVIRQFFTVYRCQLNSVNKCRRDQISLHFNLVYQLAYLNMFGDGLLEE